jgi:hypothetical protein
MLAYLGLAAAIAYLSSEKEHSGAKHAVASEQDVFPDARHGFIRSWPSRDNAQSRYRPREP